MYTPPQTYHFPNNLFTQDITEEMNHRLCENPSKDEIKSTIFSIEALKALAPDDFLSLLYQKSWATVGTELTRMVQNFFTQPYNLLFINYTNLTLISKSINPLTLDDYKPINLCNVQYKTFSKILANRLKP